MPVSDLSHDDLVKIYGPWLPRTPEDAAELMDGYPGRWWICGGWAIEAFTGVSRPHEDTDLGVPGDELPALRRHLAGRLDLWAADQERLQLLLPNDIGTDRLPPTCENVWARAGGAEPWQYDIVLTGVEADHWVFKRNPEITLPLDRTLWLRDGIPYLRAEIQLLFKAAHPRPKDQRDLEACWLRLAEQDRQWLRAALRATHPGHPWSEAQ